ncbi:MAG TPA: hypothetical protein VGH03_18320 [Caulobacteraceae bacterium]
MFRLFLRGEFGLQALCRFLQYFGVSQQIGADALAEGLVVVAGGEGLLAAGEAQGAREGQNGREARQPVIPSCFS